jgi:MFS family permease
MELLLERSSGVPKAASFWSNPSLWLREKNLSKDFWVFFAAAFFFDAGFSVYFFLFNLYLLDFGFKERSIGLVGGAFTLGSLVGTLPAGTFTRRFGLRKLLIFGFIAAPLLNALRTAWMWETAQIALAFLAGLAMCIWGVCFLPAVARLTEERNRAAGFSLIFSVSIGTSALGGVVCGYLPKWLKMAGYDLGAAEVKRLILLVSCGIAILGLFAVLRLRVPQPTPDDTTTEPQQIGRSWFREWRLHPFLLRFLPLMALWSAIIAAFTPFANVYLERNLNIPLSRIGLIFSTAQIVQLCLGLLTPVVFRRLGLVNGIVATQIAAAIALASLAGVRGERLAIALYLSFSAAQWMSAPGLYNLLMTETPDKERSTGAAMTLFCNALAGSAATAGAGILLGRFGYPPVLLGIGILALAVALMFRLLMRSKRATTPAAPGAAPGTLELDKGGVTR